MGILRTVAVAAIGVVAYRAWQRHKAGDWSSQSQEDDGGATPPHGDPRRDDLPGEGQANTAAAGSNVVGLGGTQGPDTDIGGGSGMTGSDSEAGGGSGSNQTPGGGQSSPGFGA